MLSLYILIGILKYKYAVMLLASNVAAILEDAIASATRFKRRYYVSVIFYMKVLPIPLGLSIKKIPLYFILTIL